MAIPLERNFTKWKVASLQMKKMELWWQPCCHLLVNAHIQSYLRKEGVSKSEWLIKFNWNHTSTESWQPMNTRKNSDSNTKDTGTGCTTCSVPIYAERFHGNGYKLCTVLDRELLSWKYGAICVIRIASRRLVLPISKKFQNF